MPKLQKLCAIECQRKGILSNVGGIMHFTLSFFGGSKQFSLVIFGAHSPPSSTPDFDVKLDLVLLFSLFIVA
jgi:hypothetical protein